MTGKTNAMRILDMAGISYEAVTYSSPASLDAQSVAAQIGVDPRVVYKTLVTRGADRAYYVCVISAPAALDLKAAAEQLRVKSLVLVRAEELKALTGYVRGGCSPIGMKRHFHTLVDRSAMALSCMFVSGGRIGLQLRIAPGDLVRAVRAEVATITV